MTLFPLGDIVNLFGPPSVLRTPYSYRGFWPPRTWIFLDYPNQYALRFTAALIIGPPLCPQQTRQQLIALG